MGYKNTTGSGLYLGHKRKTNITEDNKMKRYFIEEAKCGVTEGGMACGPVSGNVVVTVKFKEGSKVQWISLVEVDGIANVYLADKDIHESLIAEDIDDEEFTQYMEDHYISEFDGLDVGAEYGDWLDSIEEDPENPAVQLIRLLLALAWCKPGRPEAELIEMAKGRYADELDIPESAVEDVFNEDEYEDGDDEDDEDDEDNDFEIELPEDMEREDLYRMRLFLEADINTDSVFNDMDPDSLEMEEAQLSAVKERCEDDQDYESWKEEYLTSELAKIAGKKIITCDYLFAGIGQYTMTMPEEEKESFICWINGNGSAFFCGEREATDEEIKTYIALQANPEMND